MPSFPLTLPSVPKPRHVELRRQSVVAVSESPFSLVQQVYVHPGKRWLIRIEYPEMTTSQVALWQQVFYDLNGREGTFNFDISSYAAGITPAQSVVVFRLNENIQGWSINTARKYGPLVLDATEVL